MRVWLATVLLACLAGCGDRPGPVAVTSSAAPSAPSDQTAVVGATNAPSPVATPKALPPAAAFKKGMTFADWRPFTAPRGDLYRAPQTDESLGNLAATGANWIALVVACGQEKESSTSIACGAPRT